MQDARPHYLLYTEASCPVGATPRWRFVLQPIGGNELLSADDVELETSENRLELLAVVRGLEALDAPARVTLLTTSRYVNRGIRHGMIQWRERKWRWERFGQLVPIRNQDLWRRIDRALQFHELKCCSAHLSEGDRGLALAAAPMSRATNARTIVKRRHDQAEPNAALRGPFFRTWNRLRQGVLAPLTAIWSPAFTRAA
jgi:ribonuclease HI